MSLQPSHGVLSFDIGIKNLAWCLTISGQDFQILDWGNYNLLEEKETESKTDTITCKVCSAKPKFINSTGIFCGRHIPSTHPLIKDLSGNSFTKIPAVKGIKQLLLAKFPNERKFPTKRTEMVEKLKEGYSIPAPKQKVPHAMAIDIVTMHNSIRNFVKSRLLKFIPHSIHEVRLENQPVLKNPVMKTIQVLLFATIRDLFIQEHPTYNPICKLVHAGMKVKGKESGDKGYKARKEGSEARVLEMLSTKKIKQAETWKSFFQAHKKRSDLADAFCMCLDAYPESAVKNA